MNGILNIVKVIMIFNSVKDYLLKSWMFWRIFFWRVSFDILLYYFNKIWFYIFFLSFLYVDFI